MCSRCSAEMNPELNRDLLIKVVDHALSAENWDQRVWYETGRETACGTAMCLAGFTAIDFAGWTPVSRDNDDRFDMAEKDGQREFIDIVAMRELGLTPEESGELFSSSNTAEDIREITQRILDDEYRN